MGSAVEKAADGLSGLQGGLLNLCPAGQSKLCHSRTLHHTLVQRIIQHCHSGATVQQYVNMVSNWVE